MDAPLTVVPQDGIRLARGVELGPCFGCRVDVWMVLLAQLRVYNLAWLET
jgi:hypothetical protein